MPELRCASSSTSFIDVLDRVLDKGIVIDAWMRVSVVGIDLIVVRAEIIVASIATYLNYTDAIAQRAVPPPAPHNQSTTRRCPPPRTAGARSQMVTTRRSPKRRR